MLKTVKRDFRRVSILSRHISYVDKELVVLRKLDNTILTNSTCSSKITSDEGNYLAALSLQSYVMDPLSEKLSRARLEMVTGPVQIDRVERLFL